MPNITKFIGLAALAATMLATPGQAAPAAQCGTGLIGGPATMPIVVLSQPLGHESPTQCALNARWLTFWDGRPVQATAGGMVAWSDADSLLVGSAAPALPLRPAFGAGWSDDMLARTDMEIAPLDLSFGRQAAAYIGIAAFPLQPARIVRAELRKQEQLPTGGKPDLHGHFMVISPADGSQKWYLFLASPQHLLGPVDPLDYGWAIGLADEDRGTVEFYKPSLKGEPAHLFSLPTADIVEMPMWTFW